MRLDLGLLYVQSSTSVCFNDLAWNFRKKIVVDTKVDSRNDEKINERIVQEARKQRRERGERQNEC